MHSPTPPVQRVQVVRHLGAEPPHPSSDELIGEHPVALVFNDLSHAVMMATPTDLEDFGIGFALSEGILTEVGQCREIDVHHTAHGTEVRMRIGTRPFEHLKETRRMLAGRTGCGLCGIDSLQAFRRTLPSPHADAIPTHRPSTGRISPDTVRHAVAALEARQVMHARTGACHAAAWVHPDGHIAAVREDVGRHNALDKLIGHLARQQQLGHPGMVLMSSRASHELVSKCVRVGIGQLASVSAPTSMAVELARRSGLHLMGFCKASSVVDYSGAPSGD